MKRSNIPTYDVLIACHGFHKGGLTPLKYLTNQFGCNEKIALAAMKRELKNGNIEYGVNIMFSWVTDNGYKFLNNKS